MDRHHQLTTFQIDLAAIFFALDAAEGYLVAGGAALLASDLIARPTEDLDLFAGTPTTSVTPAKDAFAQALHNRGCAVVIVHDAPTFCRLVVERAGEQTLVDLAIDSPPHSRPTITVLGPTLAPLELAGRKLLALFGRAEARDFADVYVLAQRFGTAALIEQAQELDAGFDPGVLAQMIGTIGRFEDHEIPLAPEELPPARSFFADWASELG
ncbi:nucleotidyl transferase AbiEii/AbiGii toxin family protein [Nocardioides terrisoli]|uniref:nucleotidyl transferase AbiEii/AbiGii toxin family protein n=1 Tax=Nocardioides terrisoli TaxID=3388267 RepID=UPI00287BBAA1|nr:nucleotidyl transferase AbiEii/AbiGii toxin family protein [Nocardioides marmorisolisilvae]